MNAAWDIIHGDETTLPLIERLYHDVYGTEASQEYLRWRYFLNPVDHSPVMLAFDKQENRLAGLSAALPVHLSLGGHSVKAAQAVDSMTHPAYRNQRIFTALASASMEYMTSHGYDMVYGFPNTKAIASFVNHLNWDFTGTIPQRKRYILPVLPLLNFLCLTPRSPHGECRTGIPSAPLIEAFFATYPQEQRTSSVTRNADWLLWRHHPANRHHAHWHGLYDASGALIGLAIWNHTPGTTFGSITELWALHSSDYAVLLHAIMREAMALNIRSLCTYISNPALARTLTRCGFLTDPRRTTALTLCVRSLTTRIYPSNIHTHANWRLMGGDVDFL